MGKINTVNSAGAYTAAAGSLAEFATLGNQNDLM
jgi:hypothetical protein